MSQDKSILRKRFLNIRDNILPSDQVKLSVAAFDNLCRIDSVQPQQEKIALYFPIKSEIDALLLAKQHAEYYFLLPRVNKKDNYLFFYSWKYGEKLEKSRFFPSLYEPLQTVEDIPTIIIVPLLAFDESLNRLGYGKGYYDRTINHLYNQGHKPLTIGLAYEQQKYAQTLPNNKFDMKLNYIVTDQTIYTSHI